MRLQIAKRLHGKDTEMLEWPLSPEISQRHSGGLSSPLQRMVTKRRFPFPLCLLWGEHGDSMGLN